jgi:hypothetical protein
MIKMGLHKKNNDLFKIFVLTSMVFLSACRGDHIVKEEPSVLSGVKKILILPFKDMSGVFGENENARCPVCGKVFTTGEVEENAADMLTDHVFILLKDRKEIELIPSSQAQGVMSGLLAENKNAFQERNLGVETGRALNADAVVVGYIYRFRERVGARYSVDLPASVAFDIHLIRVVDGRVLWGGHFDETQRPLSDDLFRLSTFVQRKARWITAKEMAISGLDDLFKTFPWPTKTLRNQ